MPAPHSLRVRAAARAIRYLKARRGLTDPPIRIIETDQGTLEVAAALDDFSITVESEQFRGTYAVTLEDVVANLLESRPIQLTYGLTITAHQPGENP